MIIFIVFFQTYIFTMGSDEPRRSGRVARSVEKFQFPSDHKTNASLITQSRDRGRVRLAVKKSRGWVDSTLEGLNSFICIQI